MVEAVVSGDSAASLLRSGSISASDFFFGASERFIAPVALFFDYFFYLCYTYYCQERSMCKYCVRIVLLFLCLLLPRLSAHSIPPPFSLPENQSARVLILSSYNISNEWSFLIERNFSSYFQAEHLAIEIEYLNMSPEMSLDLLQHKALEIEQKYTGEDKIVILLGEDAWIFYRTFLAPQWKKDPSVAVFSGNYTLTMESYLSGSPFFAQEKIALSDSRQGMNATILYDDIHVKETIQLMRKLLPGMQRIALITDTRQIGRVVNQKVKQTLRDEYPSLKLIDLNMADLSTEQLIDTIRKLDPKTGIIYHSWYLPNIVIETENYPNSMKLMLGRLTHSPIFTLYDSGVKDGFLTGGYYPTITEIGDKLNSYVKQILLGAKASDLPICEVPGAQGYLNYRNLELHHIPARLYPKDAIYYEKPVDRFEKNKAFIISFIIIVLLLVCMLFMFIRYKHKQLQDSLRVKETLERSSKLQSSFIANMSHEIRTPLNAIVGFSSILKDTELKEEREEYSKIIESNNDLLLQLIDDILDLAKIEAGTLDFSYSQVDINGVMQEAFLATKLKAREMNVEIILQEGLSQCVIHTERNRIQQVINNFVSNALKFTSEGSITLGYEPCGEMIRVYVSDTGIGISAEGQKRVFERFVKINSFIRGTGLGLSICKTIIECMGGEIGFTSEEGKGSTFWFTIPMKKPFES